MINFIYLELENSYQESEYKLDKYICCKINENNLFLGLPVPREAVPRIGFVSGTKDNNW